MGGDISAGTAVRELGRGTESLGIPSGGEVARQGERFRKEHKRVWHKIKGVFVPVYPEQEPINIEFPEQEEPEPLVDEEEASNLARQRRALEARRRGRSSLRIDNPAMATSFGSGLRIP